MKKQNKKERAIFLKDVSDSQKNKRFPMDAETLEENIRRYLLAIREGRMLNSIGSVSATGMSRTLKFVEVTRAKRGERANVLNFYSLFEFFGYQKVKDSDYFRVHGCGMDMVFNTNYNNIHQIYRWGFITRKECDALAQMTPTTI